MEILVILFLYLSHYLLIHQSDVNDLLTMSIIKYYINTDSIFRKGNSEAEKVCSS